MSNVTEKPLGQYHIFLQSSDGKLFPASVELGCRDWNDDKGRKTECRINLKWSAGEIECIDCNFFVSFKRIRKQLAIQHFYPICYGASRKIIITGMAADMALGLKVYKAEIGSFPSRSQLVHIFTSGEDVEIVSVEEQEEFQRQWAESVRRKS